jgi:hypothetical protein
MPVRTSQPLTAIAIAASALGLAGCSKDLRTDAGIYPGPQIGVDSSGEWHTIVAELPSPGWEVSLDHHRGSPDAERLYVTLRQPNPLAIYPMQTVSQRLLTPVRAEEPVELFARSMPYAADENRPYQRVAR